MTSENGISRREFVQRSAALGVSGLVAGCGSRGDRDTRRRIVITDPGGEWQQAAAAAYYRPFEEATGIEVEYAARPALALGRLRAMAEAGNPEWDLTNLTDYLTHRAAAAGLIEPIDYGAVDVTNVIPAAVLSHGVGNDVYATVFAYNTDRWPAGREPKTWADFWDVERFPGRRSMSGIGYGPLEFALLASGARGADLYPLDVDRALRKMDEIKPRVSVWWTTGAQQSQLMLNGEVDLIQGWSGRIQSAIDRGAPFAIQWNQGVYQVEGWAIPKNASHREDALRFLDFALQPEPQAEFVRRIPYGPVNRLALSHLPAARARDLPTHEANLGKMSVGDAEWIGEFADELQSAWIAWKVS